MAEVTVDTREFDVLERAYKKHPRQFFERLRARLGGNRGYLHKWVRREIAAKKFDGEPLTVRTGSLRRSFDTVTHGSTIQNLRFVVGTVHGDVPYAAIQEHGGVVTPTRAKYLAIPLAAAKTGAGVARGGPRSFDNTFVMRSRSGALLIMQRRKSGNVPLFVLKKSVKIPARLGFFDAWEKQDAALRDEFGKAAVEAIRKASEGKIV